MASDTPRIELAPNLAGRNTEAVTRNPCPLVQKRVTAHTVRLRLTFVVSPVHFNHHVVQLLLLRHADSLKQNQNIAYTAVPPPPILFTTFPPKMDEIPHSLIV